MIRVALFAFLAACASRDIVASGVAGGGSGSGLNGYCVGSGPPILVGDGVTVGEGDGNPDDVCTGTVAVRTFTHALCTCEGYATSTPITTDSFDSAGGPYVPGGTAGDVGVDGALQTSALATIGGSLVAGQSASCLADAHVAHDLAAGGPLGMSVANITAGGDARVAGDIDLASLAVTGTLTVPAAQTITGAVTAGATARAPVAVAPPCACGANDLVDIAAFVRGHQADNDDAAIGLSPARLTDYTGDVTLDLPCGVYYVGPVRGQGALALRVTGRVALLVDGDLALGAPFTIALTTPDSELDLMTSGLLSSNQRLAIGDVDHPSRTRIYVGGAGTIDLSGDSQIAANFYAPLAAVALSADATIFGSLFVRRLDQAAPVVIHYDVDVMRADVGCPLM